jgi:hypothetical protein
MTIARIVHGCARTQEENLQSHGGVDRDFGNVEEKYMNELCFRATGILKGTACTKKSKSGQDGLIG